MATVGITLAYRGGEDVPVLRSAPRTSEAITSSGTSQQASAVATVDEYWTIAVSGGAVWVAFGADPTAAAGDDYLLPDGAIMSFEAAVGDKAAVIDA